MKYKKKITTILSAKKEGTKIIVKYFKNSVGIPTFPESQYKKVK